MFGKKLALSVLFGSLAFGAFACASSGFVMPTREMPAGASFTGRWSTNFGEMRLTQQPDGTTHGTFDYKAGGVIDGTVSGGVLSFDWSQPGDFQVGRREVNGKGYLVISDDGTEVNGKWGYADHYTGGGEWTGSKIP